MRESVNFAGEHGKIAGENIENFPILWRMFVYAGDFQVFAGDFFKNAGEICNAGDI